MEMGMEMEMKMEALFKSKVLWKKVTVDDSELYMNLLPFNEMDEEEVKFMKGHLSHINFDDDKPFEKNDERAKEFRDMGNQKFSVFKWNEAMELYNKSLRFATVGSENISLAYANRSMCFMRLQKYHDCLGDIELARKANYPSHLMAKLNQREKSCLKMALLQCVDCVAESQWKPSLDFDADEAFPCMANVLEIKRNEEFGLHIVAKSDLEVGQVVAVDEPYHFNAEFFGKTCCKTCLKHTKNFIPCPNCSHVMFCDVKCLESNRVHKIACGAAYLRTPESIQIIESLLIPITTFSSVEDLMDFVEMAVTTRDITDLLSIDSKQQTKYGLFLKQWTPECKMNKRHLGEIAMFYIMIMHIPEVEKRFDTKQKRRFLAHLIWYHLVVIDANAGEYSGKFSDSDETVSIEFLHEFSSFFNHSCYPNTLFSRHGNKFFGYLVRPVKKGEQLFVTYVHELLSKAERQAGLLQKYQFECKCSKCVPCFKQEDRDRIRNDPEYKSIAEIDNILIENKWRRPEIKDSCCNFLEWYGDLPWIEEIEMVLYKYKECMNSDFSTI